MAQHKAPTEVVIVATDEKSILAHLVERTWLPIAVLALIVSAVILFRQFTAQKAEAARSGDWDRVMGALEGRGTATEDESLEALIGAVGQVEDPSAKAWGLYYQALALREARRYDEAGQALARLVSEFPDHPVASERLTLPGRSAPITIAENLEQSFAAQADWERAHPDLFDNPAPPADAPKVRMTTSEGDIVVQLYPAEAPKHCENFLKLCREGFYDGTRFHRVIQGFMIQGGDPNSRDEDRTKWGQGGPGYNIEKEVNSLRHFPGYLSAAKKSGETESSGSQFFLTTGAAHHLDGLHVVYGKVVEGMEVVRAIEQGELEQSMTGPSDRPVVPVVIHSTAVLD